MRNLFERARALAGTIVAGLGLGCAGPPPAVLGVADGRLAPCPGRPNCVSSEAQDPDQRVAPLPLGRDPIEGWQRIRAAVANLPRTRIVTESADYLHAESRSALFGFVDDLELRRDPDAGVAHVRSASRLGYSDLGVNRRRVESLRAAQTAQPVPASGP
jgi:uncharacterized protein (DUF1499 family)